MRVLQPCCQDEGPIGPLAWPTAQPGDNLDYALDLSGFVVRGDYIASASVSARPSGDGEIVVSSVSVQGRSIAFWLSGGVAGRTYFIMVSATTARARQANLLVSLPINDALEELPVVVPPDWGFGTPAPWPLPNSGLGREGIVLTVLNTAGWPTAPNGLPPGAPWANGILVNFAPGGVPNEDGVPLFYGGMSAAQFLAAAQAAYIPAADPHVANQIYSQGVQACVSAG